MFLDIQLFIFLTDKSQIPVYTVESSMNYKQDHMNNKNLQLPLKWQNLPNVL